MTDPGSSRRASPGAWLSERMTVKLPRWAPVGARATALLLLIVALD